VPIISEQIRGALVRVAQVAPITEVRWLVGGSVGALLHGVPLPSPPHDLDIDTSREGALALEGLLQPYVIEPVSESDTPLYHDYLGKLSINGAQVELIGDLDIKQTEFTHHFRLTDWLWQKRALVEVDGLQVGLTPLEHQLILNIIRGREDKADQIAAFLRQHGADMDYLQETFERDRAPDWFREKIMAMLEKDQNEAI
jgi:hypothetical protein